MYESNEQTSTTHETVAFAPQATEGPTPPAGHRTFMDVAPHSLIPLLKDVSASRPPSKTQKIVEQFQKACGYTFAVDDMTPSTDLMAIIETGKPFHLAVGSSESIRFGPRDFPVMMPGIENPDKGFTDLTRILGTMDDLGSGKPIETSIGTCSNLDDLIKRSDQPKDAIAKSLMRQLAMVTDTTIGKIADLPERNAQPIALHEWDTLQGVLAGTVPDGRDVNQLFPRFMRLLNKMTALKETCVLPEGTKLTREKANALLLPAKAMVTSNPFLQRLGVKYDKTPEQFQKLQNNPAEYLRVISDGVQNSLKTTLGNLIPPSWATGI